MVPIWPVAAGLVALRHDEVDAGLDVALGMLSGTGARLADPRRRRRPCPASAARRVHHQGGRRARAMSSCGPARSAEKIIPAPASPTGPREDGSPSGMRDVVTARMSATSATCSGGMRPHGLDRQAALVGTLVASGHDQVDAVRAVAYLGLDPVEVDLELLGAVRSGSQHPSPALVTAATTSGSG